MKAYTKKEAGPEEQVIRISGEGPYHGFPIRLTIGLIVKNEEMTLDRCLSSLKPLMDAVESELIITDTGSTDRTVEIAQKYTNHILHFEWCDDFAAARNTGIDAARGEWFLFLDADEWFENTDGLIEFFNSGECDKYGSASFVVRSYHDFEGKEYHDFPVHRVTRMYPGVHFSGIVHEGFIRVEPLKFLDDFVHHYGYVFHSEEERIKKIERNEELLLRELEDNPDDLKAYYQLILQYVGDKSAKAEKYIRLGLEAERRNPNRSVRLSMKLSMIKMLYQSNKYEKTLQTVDETVREDPKMEIVWLDFYSYAQSAAFVLGEYGRSAEYGRTYLQVYEQYREHRLDRTLSLFASPGFTRPCHREQALRLLAETELNLEDTVGAMEELNQLDLSIADAIAPALRLAVEICEKSGDWPALFEFYRKACSADDGVYTAEVQKAMAGFLPSTGESGMRACHTFAVAPWGEDPCVRLCRLRVAGREEHREAAAEELDWFLRWEGDWDPAYSDAVFYGMKAKINLMPLFLKIEVDEVARYTLKMQKDHSDFLQTVREYLEAFSFENIIGLHWSVALQEGVLLAQYQEETEDDEIRLFQEYAKQSAKYVRALYRPELLSPDRAAALPRAHRFGYYMGLAFSARGRADDAAYLSNLRLALKSYPVMQRWVTLLLERFEREDELRREKAEEFNRLAGQVKENICALLEQDRLEEASRFTEQLAALMPNDPDVVRFRTLTHTEPEMNELAARLPQ